MKIGYARVSTDEQNLDLQHQALEAAGCQVVYADKGISGALSPRPRPQLSRRPIIPDLERCSHGVPQIW